MMRKLLITILLLTAVAAVAQNTYITDRAIMKDPFSGGLQAIPYAQVRVCVGTDSNNVWPCPHVAQIYDTAGNPLPIVLGSNSGQVTTDNLGRFNFQCTTANYLIQVVASGSNTPSLSYYVTCSALVGTTSTVNTFTQPQTDLALHTFNVGFTGGGNTGAILPGPGILGNANVYTAAQTGKFLDQGGSLFNVTAYGAKCDSVTDDTAAFVAASTAASAFQVIGIPAGTCRTNITINSGSNGNITYRGKGRRTSFLKPAANAPVLTIDSTGGPVQSVTVEDLGFDNTGTGFLVPAVQIKGTNINDWHYFHHLFMTQFNKAFNVTGRTIWTKLDDMEILSDTSNGIDITSSAAVNRLTINNVRVAQSTGKGLNLNSSSPNFAQITISDSNFEFNGGDGITSCNVDAFNMTGTYIENNTGISVNFPSTCTYARGLHLSGNYIWGSLSGNEIVMGTTIMSGSITGNFIAASSNTFVEQASWTTNNVYAFGNHDAGPHSLTPDANSQYHLSVNGSAPQLLINTSGVLAPSVLGVNAIRFTNSAPLTITNFTNGDPGQSVEVVNEGASTVAFSFSTSNGIFTPNGGTITLTGGQSARFFLSTANGRWMMDFENGPLTIGTNGTTITQFEQKLGTVGCATAAAVGSTCTTVITWPAPFADASYGESCQGSGVTSGVPLHGGITARTAANVTFQTVAGTAAAAQYSSIECHGFHP